MQKIYVFGHQKPDTDSVTAAISLSYLKNQLGLNTTPRILGTLNKETRFVLNYFQVKEPKQLNSLRTQIKDVNYLKNHFIDINYSISDTFHYMMDHRLSTLPITDDHHKLLGIVSMKDIAKEQISGDIHKLNASFENILKSIQGTELLRFDDIITGSIMIASYNQETFIQHVDIDCNTILIVGNRKNIIEHAIKKQAKLIIITGNGEISSESIALAKQNHVNLITTSYDTFMTSKHIGLSNFVNSIINQDNIICFDENDTLHRIKKITGEYKYSNYPVIDEHNRCLGLLRLGDIDDHQKKQAILVDHNEYEQSVDGLNEAEIVEIVDHHKIGTIGTSMPINFRNMPVGSTNTILYLLYQENNILIPPHIAGLMLSGILSDTLILKSPTATEIDKIAIDALSKIVNVDYQTYGMEMIKAGTSLKGLSIEQVLYSDFKDFNINEQNIGVGQVLTLDIEEIKQQEKEYIAKIEQNAIDKNYDVIALFITDIINNGSYVYYNKKAEEILKKSFQLEEIYQGIFLPNCISRKKQIIPNIMKIMG